MSQQVTPWWWYVGRTHLSKHGFTEIFRMPWPFSLFTPLNTLLSVLVLLPYLPLRCSLHLRTYATLRPSALLGLDLGLSYWDCGIIVSADLIFWPLLHSWLCIALNISGKQGSERCFLLTFIIISPEASSFWQPSGMFILLELVCQGLMTVWILARLPKFRPCFFQICPCSSFFSRCFSDCLAIPLVFSGHLNAHKNTSHSVMFDWSSPSHPMVLFIPFWCWHQHFLMNLVHTN